MKVLLFTVCLLSAVLVTLAMPHHKFHHRGGLYGGVSGTIGYGFGYEPHYHHEYIYPPPVQHHTVITSYPDFLY